MLKGMFLVFASLRSLGFASRPKSAVADFVEQGFRMPIRLRHPLLSVAVESSSLRQQGMAEPEGFEPSIRLYNRITV